MTNKNNHVLYTGVTSNLEKRVYEHKTKTYPSSFTAKYFCSKLVFYEMTSSVESAINREKQIKAGNRRNKLDLVMNMNPNWRDLSHGWYESAE
jgi:putative endonuclease